MKNKSWLAIILVIAAYNVFDYNYFVTEQLTLNLRDVASSIVYFFTYAKMLYLP